MAVVEVAAFVADLGDVPALRPMVMNTLLHGDGTRLMWFDDPADRVIGWPSTSGQRIRREVVEHLLAGI